MKYVETACGAKLRTAVKIIASFGMILCVVGFGLSINTSLQEVCQKNATNAKEDEGVTTGAPSIESNLTTPSPVIEEGVADEGATTIPSAQMPDDSIVVEDPELLQETEEEDSEGSGSEEGQQEEEDVDEDIHELEVAGKARREAAEDYDDDEEIELQNGTSSTDPAPLTEPSTPKSTTPTNVASNATAEDPDQNEEDGEAKVSPKDDNLKSTTEAVSPTTTTTSTTSTTTTTMTTVASSSYSSTSSTTTAATTEDDPEETTSEGPPETTTKPDTTTQAPGGPKDDCVKESTTVIAMVSIFVCLLGFAANIALLHSARKSNAKLCLVWLVWVACLYCLQVATVVNSAIVSSPGIIFLNFVHLVFTLSCGYIVASFRKKLLSGHKLSFGQDMRMSKINDDAYQQLKMEEGSYGSGDAKV